MKVSKLIVIALLTVLMLSLAVTSAAAQSSMRDTTPAPQGGIVIVQPPAHKKSDCNHNGIDDLDEFWPPDCWKAPSSGD